MMSFKAFSVSDILADYFSKNAQPLGIRTIVSIERGYALVLGEDIDDATAYLKSAHDRILAKYQYLFDLYDNDLANIMQLESKRISNIADDTFQTVTDEATEDSSLHKFNETPDAGNLDLTTDTFITSSDRVNVNTGEKVRINEHERALSETTTNTDDVARLNAIANIHNMIHDLEGLFLKDLDREILVYRN